MITFAINGVITDFDTTVDGELFDPSVALILHTVQSQTRVIGPATILKAIGAQITVGQRIVASGDVYNYPNDPVHVATEIRFDETLH